MKNVDIIVPNAKNEIVIQFMADFLMNKVKLDEYQNQESKFKSEEIQCSSCSEKIDLQKKTTD